MPNSPYKEVRYIAVGYAVYALMFIVMAAMMLSLIGWHGFQQFLNDLEIIGGTLSFLLVASIVNLVLAVGSWEILSLKGWKRNIVLGAAVGIAAVLVLSNLPMLWGWTKGELPQEIGWLQIWSPLLIAIGYVLLASMLVKSVVSSNKPIEGRRG